MNSVRRPRPNRVAWRLSFAAAALAALSLTCVCRAAFAAAEDYAAVFGQKYEDAERFLQKNTWMPGALQLSPEDTRIALAVVFPEIIRYSALEDEIQVRGLKVLYVQYGRKYANFSIGRFQMKPSFVEHLEADCDRLLSAEEKATAGIPGFERGDTAELRKRRILRLDDMAWQVLYLRLFMLVMQKRYGSIHFAGAEDRLCFYATAYNAGYSAGERFLRRAMEERRFHTELLFPKTTYSYADVALFFFRRESLSSSTPYRISKLSLTENTTSLGCPFSTRGSYFHILGFCFFPGVVNLRSGH
jgi:hypothetical protein